MGVPGFFIWLQKHYKNNENNKIINSNLDQNIDVLYLDANCLFHPQCFKILEHYSDWDDIEILENKMMERIINYIDYLTAIVNPIKKLFISVDGVAPVAKINQQRKRRFKSNYDNILKKKIKNKYNIKQNKEWSNTVITPGTEFMEKLDKKIKKYISDKTINIEYSSYQTPGEGEHKILDDIRQNNNDRVVIYGLDADLIFLALSSKKKNIYLLRESSHFNNKNKDIKSDLFEYDPINDVEEEVCFVCIDEMRRRINEQLSRLIQNRNNIIYNLDFSDDFIVICFFLGNDFLPHLPSIDIKTGGLDYLLECYVNVFIKLKYTMINYSQEKAQIDGIFLDMYMNALSRGEDYYFKQILPKHQERLKKRKCPVSDPYGKDIWELENLRTEETYVIDNIRLGEGVPEDYKFRYYRYYYGVGTYIKSHINILSEEYLKGIKWVVEYYFNGCICWEWQYPYNHGPFISDISDYMMNNSFDINQVVFKNSKPIDPFTQLLSVLPPQCSELLPSRYRNLVHSQNSPILDYYPIEIHIDYLNKDMEWKGIPMIPTIDINRIKNAVINIKLNKKEILRNIITKKYNNKPIK